jgi:putative solute:sodium symporter small subunit
MTQKKSSATEANDRIYKTEIILVTVSTILCMMVGMGCLFMRPFPELLQVYVWGFPFPFWYQNFVAYIGVIFFIYLVVVKLTKIDEQKANAEKEV